MQPGAVVTQVSDPLTGPGTVTSTSDSVGPAEPAPGFVLADATPPVSARPPATAIAPILNRARMLLPFGIRRLWEEQRMGFIYCSPTDQHARFRYLRQYRFRSPEICGVNLNYKSFFSQKSHIGPVS